MYDGREIIEHLIIAIYKNKNKFGGHKTNRYREIYNNDSGITIEVKTRLWFFHSIELRINEVEFWLTPDEKPLLLACFNSVFDEILEATRYNNRQSLRCPSGPSQRHLAKAMERLTFREE